MYIERLLIKKINIKIPKESFARMKCFGIFDYYCNYTVFYLIFIASLRLIYKNITIMNNTLQRFIDAQADSYDTALAEIRNGRKVTHWIWYIFPQIKGLGFSYNAQYYGISSLQEAKDYLQNELLRKRLFEITEALLQHKGEDIERIMGGIDALKLKSSMTLFDIVFPGSIFGEVLDEFYGGERCAKTLELKVLTSSGNS